MAAPGWPKTETIPEASVVRIDADSSHHGSHHSSHHGSRQGSRHGSVHGGSSYAQALQASRDSGNAAKLERRPSRRLENAVLGVNDYNQDYAGDYPVERGSQVQTDAESKTHICQPWHMLVVYFTKWIGGIDEVRASCSW